MLKLVIVFSRLVFLLLGASVLLALAVSSLHAPGSISLPLGVTKVDAISSSIWPDHPADQPCCYLIDRQSDWCNAEPMPFGKRWGQLSVSQWCDADGNTEAVCQSFGFPYLGADHDCWGLARLRLPAGEVIDEVRLDVLPTGRACWVPDHPGRIVFAAGDGRLYRHDFPGWAPDFRESYTDAAARSNQGPLSRVIWKGHPPLPGLVFITDPFWPNHPLLRHFLFATVIPQTNHREQGVIEVTELAWLLMSEDGAAIEASGLLRAPTKLGSAGCTLRKRFPIVEAGEDGTIRLVYLTSVSQSGKSCLEVIPLEIDPETRHPRVPAGCQPGLVYEDCAPVPPLFSADGMSVYLISRSSGRIVKRQIPGDSPGTIQIASKG